MSETSIIHCRAASSSACDVASGHGVPGAAASAPVRRPRPQAILLLLLACLCGMHSLDGLAKDPTVPPAVWLAAQPKTAGTTQQAVVGDGASRVQVIVHGKSRRFALIDGKPVVVGDVINDSKVSAVKADRIEMDDGKKTVEVAPDVKKKSPVAVAGRKKSVVIPEIDVPSKATRE